MIVKTCDRCGKKIPIENGMLPMIPVKTKLFISLLGKDQDDSRMIDLCDDCDQKVRNFIFLKREAANKENMSTVDPAIERLYAKETEVTS